MNLKSFAFAILAFTFVAYAKTPQLEPYEGFFSAEALLASQDLTPSVADRILNSAYRLEIGEGEHGSAFAINARGYLVTNVHNLAGCLREHGVLKTGYAGEKGPLPCKSLKLTSSDSTKSFTGVEVLGSFPLLDVETTSDVALIHVNEMLDGYLELAKNLPSRGESLFIAGFPGATSRDLSRIKHVSQDLTLAQEGIETYFKIDQDEIGENNVLMTFWLQNFFVKIQPAIGFSNYLSGKLLQNDSGFQPLSPEGDFAAYSSKLAEHTRDLEKAIADMKLNIERVREKLESNKIEEGSYPEADDNFRFMRASFDTQTDFRLFFESDGGPGLSGSPVLNSLGQVVGHCECRGIKRPAQWFSLR